MAKNDEINYLNNIGFENVEHAFNKPFSDPKCGMYLSDIGSIMNLLPGIPAKILDMGVGSGWTSIFLSLYGYEVLGIDIAPDMIELARKNSKKYQAGSVDFKVQDYEEMKFIEEFEAVIFYDCLHHADDEGLALKRGYEALKPGGTCITIEPGEGHSMSEVSAEVMKKWGVTEKDMPPYKIIELAEKAGFSKFKIYRRIREPVLIIDSGDMSAPDFTKINMTVKQFYNLAKIPLRFLLKGIKNRDLRSSNIVVLCKE